MSTTITKEIRIKDAGNIKCYICKIDWNGHLILDEKMGFQLYCEVCDLLIWMEKEFKIFVSLSDTGKVVSNDYEKLKKSLKLLSFYSNDIQNHPIHEARKNLFDEKRKKLSDITQNNIFNTVKAHIELGKIFEDEGLNSDGLEEASGGCPFCGFNKMSIAKAQNIFYCFECHIGGDSIAFIAKLKDLNQIEAVNYIIEKFKLPIEKLLTC